MDDLLSSFIETQYTEETKGLIINSFAVFDSFDVNIPYTQLNDIAIRHGNDDSTNLATEFIECVRTNLIEICKAHGIVLVDDISLSKALEVCTGICILQRLENYESLARKLEGTKPDDEIVCEIFEKVTNLTFIELMDCVEHLEEGFMNALREFVRSKEEETESFQEEMMVFKMETLKAFKGKFGDDAIGLKMIRTGTKPGFEFRSYFNLVKDHIVAIKDKESLAKNILSLILMSSDGSSNPITFFRQIAPEFCSDLTTINEIEKELLRLSSELESYRRAYEGITNE